MRRAIELAEGDVASAGALTHRALARDARRLRLEQRQVIDRIDSLLGGYDLATPERDKGLATSPTP